MTGFKLGKLDAVRPHALADLAIYARGKLPTPPASVPVPTVADWGMMDNDRLGCCTISAVGHLIQAANADVTEHDPVPSDAEVEQQYFALSGGQDSGLNEHQVLNQWYRAGLFGDNKVAGYAPVNRHQLLDIHVAVACYGACYVGVALPQSAQEQFGAGEPWTIVPHSPIEGGHAIVFVAYDPQWLYAVTWGAVVKVSYAWWAKYGDEAWCVIPQAFVEAGRGPEIDLTALRKDLSLLR